MTHQSGWKSLGQSSQCTLAPVSVSKPVNLKETERMPAMNNKQAQTHASQITAAARISAPGPPNSCTVEHKSCFLCFSNVWSHKWSGMFSFLQTLSESCLHSQDGHNNKYSKKPLELWPQEVQPCLPAAILLWRLVADLPTWVLRVEKKWNLFVIGDWNKNKSIGCKSYTLGMMGHNVLLKEFTSGLSQHIVVLGEWPPCTNIQQLHFQPMQI